MGIDSGLRMNPRQLNPLLLVGDWVVLALFVFLGQLDHDVLDIGRLLMQVVVLAIPWTVASLLLGAQQVGTGAGWAPFMGRTVVAWLVAAPLGLIIRALVQGQATIIVAFMLVTMGLGGLFLLGWRALYYWWRRRV